MLGYSDSGKDAGRAAAAWALYKCQEELVQVTHTHTMLATIRFITTTPALAVHISS